MKSSRYIEKSKRVDPIKEYEKQQEEEKKKSEKKSWEEGGEFTKEDNPYGRLFDTSSFEILFPQYREPYFKQHWKTIEQILDNKTLKATVDYVKGKLFVSTTDKTFDPYIIIKGMQSFLKMSLYNRT